jgi:hypothetical protein
MNEEEWLQKSREIITDMKEWRQDHKKATFVEIEKEVHRRMVQLEAHLLQDVATESESREWGRESDHQAPECPQCHIALSAKGKKTRALQGNGGATVSLTRTYGSCPKCGQSFFPS